MSEFDLPFALTISVAIIAVILTYVDMRRRLKQEREFSKSMANLIGTLREELQLFRKPNEDLARQQLLAQREKQQWKQFTDVAKGIGWFLEHMEDNEDEN